MRTRYRLIVVFLFAVLVLCAVNIYLTVSSQNTPRIKELVAAQVEQGLLAQPIPQDGVQGIQGLPGANGKNGTDGRDSISHDRQTLIKEVVTRPEKGDRGEPGDRGKDARPIILSTDDETGDLMWKYEGDTLWTLLIERCELTVSCKE